MSVKINLKFILQRHTPSELFSSLERVNKESEREYEREIVSKKGRKMYGI